MPALRGTGGCGEHFELSSQFSFGTRHTVTFYRGFFASPKSQEPHKSPVKVFLPVNAWLNEPGGKGHAGPVLSLVGAQSNKVP